MNVYVRGLASALARAGVHCDLYTRASDPAQAAVLAIEPGLAVHHVPAGPLAPVAKEHLPGLVDEFAEGVLHRIENGHPADAIHANYWLSGMAGHRLKHHLDVPLVSTFHTLDRVKAEADEADDSLLRSHAEAKVMGCSDAILASCDDEVDQLVRLYDVDPARVHIVAPGVDHAFFAPAPSSRAAQPRTTQARHALALPASGHMVLFVGRIQPLKGLEVAVRALARPGIPPGTFLVVVGGPSGAHGDAEVHRIASLVDQLGLHDRVVFVPPQPHELLSTYYRAADIVVVPSRSESFGLVALEAAACGVPVVASAVGGLNTLVEHGRTGFLVEGRDPGAFAARVEQLLVDPVLAAEMGRQAAIRARGYTWSVAAGRLRRLYGDLTARSLVECR